MPELRRAEERVDEAFEIGLFGDLKFAFGRRAAEEGAEEADGTVWYRIERTVVAMASDEESRAAIGRMMTDIIPMGGSRVAFPIGSTGRTVYRVWRSRGAEGRSGASRTRILGVRAGRSLRRPA